MIIYKSQRVISAKSISFYPNTRKFKKLELMRHNWRAECVDVKLEHNCIDPWRDIFMTFFKCKKVFLTPLNKTKRVNQGLYWNQVTRELNKSTHTEEFQIIRALRKGYILLSILFNLYVEKVPADALG